jgi:hypothetical protein
MYDMGCWLSPDKCAAARLLPACGGPPMSIKQLGNIDAGALGLALAASDPPDCPDSQEAVFNVTARPVAAVCLEVCPDTTRRNFATLACECDAAMPVVLSSNPLRCGVVCEAPATFRPDPAADACECSAGYELRRVGPTSVRCVLADSCDTVAGFSWVPEAEPSAAQARNPDRGQPSPPDSNPKPDPYPNPLRRTSLSYSL